MADLSLKQLDDGLMKAVKLAAFTAGKSQRDFVIQVLSEAVNGEDGSVGRDRDAAVQVADNEAGGLPKARRKEGVRGLRGKVRGHGGQEGRGSGDGARKIHRPSGNAQSQSESVGNGAPKDSGGEGSVGGYAGKYAHDVDCDCKKCLEKKGKK